MTAGSAWSGPYRALELWEVAVNEVAWLHQHDVVAVIDHAGIRRAGGPCRRAGQQHVLMTMYIARSEGGKFRVSRGLGQIEPQE